MMNKALLGLLVLTGWLVGGLFTPAAAQDRESHLQFVEALHEMGLVTDYGDSQQVQHSTVTLNWAYADELVVIFDFTLHNALDKNNDPAGEFYYVPQVMFETSSGHTFSGLYNTGNRITLDDGQIAWEYTYGFNLHDVFLAGHDGMFEYVPDYWQNQYGGDLPDALRFRLLVDVNPVDQMENALPLGIIDDAPFVFDFKLPMHHAVTITPDVTQTDNDLSMTLESIALSPVYTQLTMCTDLPDGADWQPVARLVVNGVEAVVQRWGMVNLPSPDDVRRCFHFEYQFLYDMQPGMLTFTVDRMRLSAPDTVEYWESVAAELAKHDIVIEVVMEGGQYYKLVSKPDDMTDETFSNLLFAARDELLPTVTGSWVFDVELPGAG